jgi:hypothetical protein
MDDKTHEGTRVHERKEGDGDSMWQPRCNIIDVESHPTCSNKTHWCSTSFCSKTNWKWWSHIQILFNERHGGDCAYQGIIKKWHNKLITMFGLKTSLSGSVKNIICF